MSQATPPPENWEELHRKHRDGGMRKRLFTVTGPRPVHGKRKGEILEIELTEAQADALILAGHITEKSRTAPMVVPVKVAESTAVETVKSSRAIFSALNSKER